MTSNTNQVSVVETTEMLKGETGEEGQYLTFLLNKEMYAIGILHIKEILEYGQLTTVPMMPDFIRGVINLRGSVVPVVDLAARFGDTQSGVTKRTCVVILEVSTEDGHQDIGIMVDSVSAVMEISGENIEAPPAFGAKIRADFIEGMGNLDGKFIIILAVNKVLSVDELALVSQVKDIVQDN